MFDKNAVYIDEAFVRRAGVPAELFLKRDLGFIVAFNGRYRQ